MIRRLLPQYCIVHLEFDPKWIAQKNLQKQLNEWPQFGHKPKPLFPIQESSAYKGIFDRLSSRHFVSIHLKTYKLVGVIRDKKYFLMLHRDHSIPK